MSLFYFRADSVTWNPHKLMGALLQCSTIHFKEDVSTNSKLTQKSHRYNSKAAHRLTPNIKTHSFPTNEKL